MRLTCLLSVSSDPTTFNVQKNVLKPADSGAKPTRRFGADLTNKKPAHAPPQDVKGKQPTTGPVKPKSTVQVFVDAPAPKVRAVTKQPSFSVLPDSGKQKPKKNLKPKPFEADIAGQRAAISAFPLYTEHDDVPPVERCVPASSEIYEDYRGEPLSDEIEKIELPNPFGRDLPEKFEYDWDFE